MSAPLDDRGIMSRDIPLGLIDPDPEQPRKHFDPAALADLAASMGENGLAVPILVRPVGNRFVIVHGERRWRAAASLGWAAIRAEVRELDADRARWLSLVENVQRHDLTPIEEARAYQARLAQGMTQEALARRLGKHQTYVAQKLRLLTLPEPVAVYVQHGALTEGHARQLLRVRNIYGTMADGQEPTRALRPVTQADIDPPMRTADGQPIRVGPDPARAHDYRDGATVFCLFRDIRPEDNPPVWIGIDYTKRPVEPALTAGCEAFWRWLEAAEFRPPSWAVAAFWWASLAVRAELSVAKLAQGLDGWRQRFLGCLAWAEVRARTKDRLFPEPGDRGPDAEEAWATLSDLRHAGALDLIGNLPPDRVPDLIDQTIGGDNYPLPSHLQPWGFGHERYAALVNGEGVQA